MASIDINLLNMNELYIIPMEIVLHLRKFMGVTLKSENRDVVKPKLQSLYALH